MFLNTSSKWSSQIIKTIWKIRQIVKHPISTVRLTIYLHEWWFRSNVSARKKKIETLACIRENFSPKNRLPSRVARSRQKAHESRGGGSRGGTASRNEAKTRAFGTRSTFSNRVRGLAQCSRQRTSAWRASMRGLIGVLWIWPRLPRNRRPDEARRLRFLRGSRGETVAAGDSRRLAAWNFNYKLVD